MQPMPEFLSALKQAQSNDPDIGTGADVFQQIVAKRNL
jgi:hypothetical protein